VIEAVCGVALLIPLASALDSSAIPVALRVLLVALWLTAVVRPHAALVALTLLVPFGAWLLAAIDAAPVRYTEALVIATLSGALIAMRRRPLTPLRSQPPALAPAAVVFCGVVACSAAVVLTVTQVGTHRPWLFLRGFAPFLTRDYLVGPPGEFVGVADAALLVEGVALLFLVARHARDGVTRPPQLLRAFAIAGACAAALTLERLIVTAGAADSLGELVTRLVASRTSAHVADLNAAGSYFAMAGLAALALAFARPGSDRPAEAGPYVRGWLVTAVVLVAAVWFTGSRMAVVATVGSLVAAAITVGPLRPRNWPRWSIGVAALAAAVVLGAIAIGVDPRPSAARGASNMVNMRAAFMLTGLRMIASAPVFGVGIGRYFEMSGRFMPPSIYWFYFHENAHNNFLQIGGELGAVGLAAFVWLLLAATIRLLRGLRASPGDRLLAGTIAALGAFVATWMTSHPMLVAEVAFPFWILLGIGIARADGGAQPPLASPTVERQPAPQLSKHATLAAVLVVVALVASVSLRARREAATLDLARQSFGFYAWEEENGQKFRWTSRRATFFVPSSARELRLPVRASHIGANGEPTEVSIAIGGRTLHKVQLARDDWTTIRILLPREATQNRYQRVDVITEPTWSPAALLGGGNDVRVLGVQVGEPATRP